MGCWMIVKLPFRGREASSRSPLWENSHLLKQTEGWEGHEETKPPDRPQFVGLWGKVWLWNWRTTGFYTPHQNSNTSIIIYDILVQQTTVMSCGNI